MTRDPLSIIGGSLADLHETDWHACLTDWLAPFLDHLRHPSQKHWAPVYLQGLLGPGERKSIEPIADRLAPGAFQQLHHFVSASSWRPEPLEVDSSARPRNSSAAPTPSWRSTTRPWSSKGAVGRRAHQYCGQLGKPANCQVLVSLTLARREVPVCIGLRLFLPKPGRTTPTAVCAPGFRCPSRSSPSGASPWRRSTGSGPPGRCSAAWPPTPSTARRRRSGPV